MNVGIDITPILYGRGVSRYTRNLVESLLDYTQLDLSLFGSSWRQFKELSKQARVLTHTSSQAQLHLNHLPPSLLAIPWQLGLLPVSSWFPQVDVIHSWDWLQPPDKKVPLVSTIHDLAILKFPETAHPKILKMHQRSWKIFKERQAHLIAVSQTTKKDLIEFLDFPADHIHVVYEALPVETIAAGESLDDEIVDKITARLHLTRPFILSVGTQEPRKNILNLLAAWEPLHKDFDLVIAGAAGWDESQSSPWAKHPQIHWLGKVSDQVLAALYTEASLFVYPSLYEGFGLPILEAFHFGTPVVTANTSSMPEVAGNAAELVDPNSPEAIGAGMKLVLNESLTDQQKRLQKMVLRLQLFDWKKVAQQTQAVYEQALRSHP